MAISTFDIALEEHFPTPLDLGEQIPLRKEDEDFIAHSRKTIENILLGEDKRLLLVVGPCSIHDVDAAFEYAERLSKLSKSVSSEFFIVMRTYFEKARTGHGWKGLIYDPDLDGSGNMNAGLKVSREFLSQVTSLKLPCASEILGINLFPYFSDFLSWGCIGARTSSSQPHREIASSLSFPIGFKNSVEGNLLPAILGIHSSSVPHVFLGMDAEGRFSEQTSEGNAFCHLVLRGGEKGPNYKRESILEALHLLKKYRINTRLLVDCSHDNCRKDPLKQLEIFDSVLESAQEVGGIAGLMLESFLEEGSNPSGAKYGCSITDPCLSWNLTENLIEKTFFALRS